MELGELLKAVHILQLMGATLMKLILFVRSLFELIVRKFIGQSG